LHGRYALLIHNAGGDCQPEDLFKAPAECIDMAGLLCRQHASLADATAHLGIPNGNKAANEWDARIERLLQWLMAADITRRMPRFEVLLSCLAIEASIEPSEHRELQRLAAWLASEAAGQQAAQAAAKAQASGQPIMDAVRDARLAWLAKALAGSPAKP
jgi:hypothetical protein